MWAFYFIMCQTHSIENDAGGIIHLCLNANMWTRHFAVIEFNKRIMHRYEFLGPFTLVKLLRRYHVAISTPGWPDWAKFCHLGDFLWRWAIFFLKKIAQWFVQNFSHNCPKLTLIRLKFCFKRGFLHVFQKYSKNFISSFMYKKKL